MFRLSLVITVALLLGLSSCSTISSDPSKSTAALGPQVEILPAGWNGIPWFPDQATVVYEYEPVYKLFMAGGDASLLLEGSDLTNLTNSRILFSKGSFGEIDNSYAGICGFYKDPVSNIIYGFYHAEDREGMVQYDPTLPPYYGSTAAAVSTNDCLTWEKKGRILKSFHEKTWSYSSNQNDRGIGEPSFIKSKDGQYLYAYYTDHSYMDELNNWRSTGANMARASLSSDLSDPANWFKYHDGNFDQPGIGGYDSMVIDPFQISANGGAASPHVNYSAALGKFVMVINFLEFGELQSQNYQISGTYFSYSDDGISWAKPVQIMKHLCIPRAGQSSAWMASIIWDKDSSTKGWLVYAFTDGNDAMHMVGRRIDAAKLVTAK
jgi:hypothetical protein